MARLNFTDPDGLEAVELQFGARYARQLPIQGPQIMEIVTQIDQIFLLAQVKRLMLVNGFAFASPIQLQKSAMSVIRYCNASAEPWYFNRVRSAGSWQWQLIACDQSNKQPYRDRDAEHVLQSRNVIVRQSVAREVVPFSEPRATPSHIQQAAVMSPRGPEVTQLQLNHVRDAFHKYITGMNHPPGALRAEHMAKILMQPGFVEFIGQDFVDTLYLFNEVQIMEICALVYDMLEADRRGGNSSLTGPDGSLGLL